VKLLQALRYFLRQAAVNLFRGWRVSLVAVLTIAVSLLLGGGFLLVGGNLARSVERWRGEMRVVVYLQPGTPERAVRGLAAELSKAAWVRSAEAVPADEARARFREVFPGLSDLLEGWEEEPLPASIEIALEPGTEEGRELGAWLAELRRRPGVDFVDDDREWLGQLETLVAVVRGVGLTLAAGMLVAAVFTIGSVIRLTAFLHHEEIGILRLVGATEFFIRGPFYMEGLLQGLAGGALATGALWGLFELLQASSSSSLLLPTILTAEFLSLRQTAALVLAGGAAGLIGAVMSLRRERL
jgi:cell division transport system permease protein